MSKKRFIFLVFILHTVCGFSNFPKTHILSSTYPVDSLNNIIVRNDGYNPFLTKDKEGWNRIPQNIKAGYIKGAEKYLNHTWKVIPAAQFLEFKANGNRQRYENLNFGRRDALVTLVMGELMERKGRFVPDIINGCWAVCEETWWGIPAHYPTNLPNIESTQVVDLFNAETGATMAIINYFLKDDFDKVSPLISRRISREIDRRVLQPCMSESYWWMSAGMNWNPWICSNWLSCVLLEEKNTEKRNKAIEKILKCTDAFIDSYHEDGGCDEGPAYWGRAGGSLFDILYQLYHVSDGRIDIFQVNKIKEIGRFIYKTYISNSYFVNFADARPQIYPDWGNVYDFGHYIQDPVMKSFAAYELKKGNYLKSDTLSVSYLAGFRSQLIRCLNVSEIQKTVAKEPLERDHFLPHLEVMIARSKAESSKGFFFAAKGGHNAEAHNHNDVGNYVLYNDGYPLIIDMGVGTYERKTFGPQRYSIWTMQSGYHNVPVINGVDQKNGKNFKAQQVNYKKSNKQVEYTMELAGAYPSEANVETWVRNFRCERKNKLTVSEKYKLKNFVSSSSTHLMTTYQVEKIKDGFLRLTQSGKPSFKITYNPHLFEVEIDSVKLEDPMLINNWNGNEVNRIRLIIESKDLNNEVSYSIEPF